MKNIIVSFVFVMITVPLIAGGNISLEIADNFYSRLAYTKAAEYYEKYLEKDKNAGDVEVWQKLANCYELTNEYESLSNTLKTIVGLEGEIDPAMFLAYGEVLQITGKSEQAVKWYERYLEKRPEDRRAASQLEACLSGAALLTDGFVRYEISNMDFNTSTFEYGPNIFNGTLLYTSTGSEENATNKIFQWTGGNYSDIRQYERDSHEVFIFFNQMEKVNTTYNDGIFTVDPIDQQFYYTRNNYDVYKSFNKKGLNSENHMNLKIYVAENDLGRINDINEFAYNDDEYNTAHPTISSDGSYLVFVSDMPSETSAGRDLYFCSRTDSNWSEPTLLTSDINTEGDEIFPMFHEDGSLYFSSDGLGSIGGLDIFRAEVDFENNALLDLERLKSHINSTYDDFGIVFENMREGYFTSDRPDGKGKDDIYSFEDQQRVLSGIVISDETGEPIPFADVTIRTGGVDVFIGKADADARFMTFVYDDQAFDLTGDADYYYQDEETVNTADYHSKADIEVVLELPPVRYNVIVLDDATGDPIPGAMVDITFGCDQEAEQVFTNFSGKHSMPVYKDCEYDFKAKTSGYLANSLTWTSPEEDGDEVVVIRLEKVVLYQPIVLRSIYYDFDKATLRLNESSEDLDKLKNFLRDNRELTIEINSHTDARGSKRYNEDLSQRRAQSVVDWLLARHVDKDRLNAKGYGENSPVNECVDGVKCSEEEHQLNRRTEFQVVNADGTTKIASDARNDIKINPCLNCPF